MCQESRVVQERIGNGFSTSKHKNNFDTKSTDKVMNLQYSILIWLEDSMMYLLPLYR